MQCGLYTEQTEQKPNEFIQVKECQGFKLYSDMNV